MYTNYAALDFNLDSVTNIEAASNSRSFATREVVVDIKVLNNAWQMGECKLESCGNSLQKDKN